MVTAITVYTCSSYCLFIYTFSPVSDVDVEESIFFNAKLEISDQYLLIGLIFMNTFKKKQTRNDHNLYKLDLFLFSLIYIDLYN